MERKFGNELLNSYKNHGFILDRRFFTDLNFPTGYFLAGRVCILYRTFRIELIEFQRLYRLCFSDNEGRDLVQEILREKYKI